MQILIITIVRLPYIENAAHLWQCRLILTLLIHLASAVFIWYVYVSLYTQTTRHDFNAAMPQIEIEYRNEQICTFERMKSEARLLIWKQLYTFLISFIITFSNRYGNWHKDPSKAVSQKNVPRLIVFILGGATYSEFRIGYEVTADKKNWEVIIGKY